MKKLADIIVEKKKLILFIFILITIISLLLSTKVKINEEISKYLPNSSEVKTGINIMDKEFESEKSSTLNIMFNNIVGHEKDILKELENIKNISKVEYDESKNYNKDSHTLYKVNVDNYADSKISKKVYEDIKETFKDYDVSYSGTISKENDAVMPSWIIVTAISSAMIILIIMCNSYIEPFLFLFTIGLAVFINKGTNIIFPSVSNVTDSISAILQMALSMDYSIMLMNRYRKERTKIKNKNLAMKKALENSFTSISSSSVTTIVGLLALVFMSFTIGKDLGFVLAKGVLLSLICIFFVLPGLILIFDNLIEKTQKKIATPRMDKLGRFSYNMRYITFIVTIIILVGGFLLKGNLNILYTQEEKDEIGKVFKENNQIVVVYNNKDEEKVSKLCSSLTTNKINESLCFANTIGEKLEYDKLNNRLKEYSKSSNLDQELIKILFYDYYNKGQESITLNDLVNFIDTDLENNNINISLTESLKNNLGKIKLIASNKELNKVRTASELAKEFELDESIITRLMIYNLKDPNSTLTIKEIISLLNDPNISTMLKDSLISQDLINDLSNFILKETYNKELSKDELSKMFNIREEETLALITYYYLTDDLNNTMTIEEFTNFILNNASNLISDDTKKTLLSLNILLNNDLMEKELTKEELANLFDIEEESVKKILLLKNIETISNSEMTIEEFENILLENKDLLEDNQELLSLLNYLTNNKNILNEKMSLNSLTYLFDNIEKDLINNTYILLNIDENTLISPIEYLELLKSNLKDILDQETYNKINLVSIIMNLITEGRPVSSIELSTLLRIDLSKVNTIYLLYDIEKDYLKSSPQDILNFLVENKDLLSSDNQIKLNRINNILLSKSKKLFYEEMSNTLEIDLSKTKQLFALYKTYNEEVKVKPIDLISIICKDTNNELSLASEVKEKILLLQKIIELDKNKSNLTASTLSNTLKIDSESIENLYAYNKFINNNQNTITIRELFAILNNNELIKEIDESLKSKITLINNIIKNTTNNKKYTPNEFQQLANSFNERIDKNKIDLLYLYYGVKYNYQNYKMTVEEFIAYLNDSVLKNQKYESFITKDTNNMIEKSNKLIKTLKKQIVGKNYSRIVLNTTYHQEDEEVFTFISNLKKDLKKISKDTYIVGNSAMAYELNETFEDEFNFISILTMLLIFLVVLITFKSIIVAASLTLLIQCAVYITMSIISVFGGNIYFISLLIVQSILLGATIDYAILYTSYYIWYRNTYNKKGAIINSYKQSINTIITSASVLIIVTLIVGIFVDSIASKICLTLSQGTLFASLLVIFFLPAVLSTLDRFIIKKD